MRVPQLRLSRLLRLLEYHLQDPGANPGVGSRTYPYSPRTLSSILFPQEQTIVISAEPSLICLGFHVIILVGHIKLAAFAGAVSDADSPGSRSATPPHSRRVFPRTPQSNSLPSLNLQAIFPTPRNKSLPSTGQPAKFESTDYLAHTVETCML